MRLVAIKIFRCLSATCGAGLVRHRLVVVTAVQISLILAANLSAFALRFDGDIPPDYWRLALKTLPLVGLIYGLALWVFGIQRGLWRYVGLHDLARIAWASFAGAVACYLLFHWVLGRVDYPRSVIILTGLLAGGFLAGIRLGVRGLREWLRIIEPSARRVLIVGAGNAAELLTRDLQANPSYHYCPVAFVDDAPVKQRMKIHGIPVAGTIADVREVVERYAAQEIIVAIPSASPDLMHRILAVSEPCGIPLKTLPTVKQMLDSPVSMRHVRPVSIEDLLQREPIRTDLKELHPLLEGKRIAVTGAGGSIGSELCRQVARYRPALLVLLERHENSLYAIDRELRETFPDMRLHSFVADTTVPERIADILRDTAPQAIFHAAAHKHVPLMEDNPGEAVRNNVFGTRTVAEAAIAAGVELFVLVSTDKAVNPMNVMGATKRLAELVVQEMDRRGATRFTVVRFGNVLGSNGSVVPLFAEQIRRGGPVTVTHPEIRRYFMTIPEAVQLILQASVMARGGDVFVLDMGEQIRVLDLARNMIRLSGHVPDRDIRISFIGLRPGEKMYEELFDQSEQVEATAHDRIMRAAGRPVCGPDEIGRRLKTLEALLHCRDSSAIVRSLMDIVSRDESHSLDAAT